MEIQERREHPRCSEDTGIVYSFINKLERHAAVARNYSRLGMYFESDNPLALGTIIVIRTLTCEAADDLGAGSIEKGPAPYYCKDSHLAPEPCREIKSLVTAQVKRCEKTTVRGGEGYGIGVQFVRPAV